MARWPEKALGFLPRHPEPNETDEVLFADDNTLWSAGDVDDDGRTEVENLRTGEEQELRGPIDYIGWSDDKTPMGVGLTPEVEDKAREVAKAHQRSPRDTFENLSERSQQNDVARRAEEVTDRTLLYNLNPTEYDYENFDTPEGDARGVFDL